VQPPQPAVPPLVANPDFMLTVARVTDIPGWAQADFAPALTAFRRQCAGWRVRGPDAWVTGGR
jgi:hypothetical protein